MWRQKWMKSLLSSPWLTMMEPSLMWMMLKVLLKIMYVKKVYFVWAFNIFMKMKYARHRLGLFLILRSESGAHLIFSSVEVPAMTYAQSILPEKACMVKHGVNTYCPQIRWYLMCTECEMKDNNIFYFILLIYIALQYNKHNPHSISFSMKTDFRCFLDLQMALGDSFLSIIGFWIFWGRRRMTHGHSFGYLKMSY